MADVVAFSDASTFTYGGSEILICEDIFDDPGTGDWEHITGANGVADVLPTANVVYFSSNSTSSSIRCMTLWNGSTNIAPPSGWEGTSFNDSASPWTTPFHFSSGGSSGGTGGFLWTPGTGNGIPLSNTERSLFRQTMTVPSSTGLNPNYRIRINQNDTRIGIWFNGILIAGSAGGGAGGETIFVIPTANINFGGFNVVAIEIANTLQSGSLGDAYVNWNVEGLESSGGSGAGSGGIVDDSPALYYIGNPPNDSSGRFFNHFNYDAASVGWLRAYNQGPEPSIPGTMREGTGAVVTTNGTIPVWFRRKITLPADLGVTQEFGDYAPRWITLITNASGNGMAGFQIGYSDGTPSIGITVNASINSASSPYSAEIYAGNLRGHEGQEILLIYSVYPTNNNLAWVAWKLTNSRTYICSGPPPNTVNMRVERTMLSGTFGYTQGAWNHPIDPYGFRYYDPSWGSSYISIITSNGGILWNTAQTTATSPREVAGVTYSTIDPAKDARFDSRQVEGNQYGQDHTIYGMAGLTRSDTGEPLTPYSTNLEFHVSTPTPSTTRIRLYGVLPGSVLKIPIPPEAIVGDRLVFIIFSMAAHGANDTLAQGMPNTGTAPLPYWFQSGDTAPYIGSSWWSDHSHNHDMEGASDTIALGELYSVYPGDYFSNRATGFWAYAYQYSPTINQGGTPGTICVNQVLKRTTTTVTEATFYLDGGTLANRTDIIYKGVCLVLRNTASYLTESSGGPVITGTHYGYNLVATRSGSTLIPPYIPPTTSFFDPVGFIGPTNPDDLLITAYQYIGKTNMGTALNNTIFGLVDNSLPLGESQPTLVTTGVQNLTSTTTGQSWVTRYNVYWQKAGSRATGVPVGIDTYQYAFANIPPSIVYPAFQGSYAYGSMLRLTWRDPTYTGPVGGGTKRVMING